MNYLFRFANSSFLLILIPLLCLTILLKTKFVRFIFYKYSLASFFKIENLNASNFYKRFFFLLRFIILSLLIFLIAKPQFANTKSKLKVHGIDIVLDIDVSGSMQCIDDTADGRNRIDIAKDEAIRFVNKRENDPIGIVIFARQALSRCPLTLDKKMLNEVINDIKLGEIDYRDTHIGTSIATCINRLKSSKAKSKIIILLTDGQPSPNDIPIDAAIDMAKKLGIKIYTIGIGNELGGFNMQPFLGLVPCGIQLNKELLEKIANETGGKFFQAANAQDMRNIYDTIDRLEKTEFETNIFNKYYDFFIPLILLSILLIFIEQIFVSFIWFKI